MSKSTLIFLPRLGLQKSSIYGILNDIIKHYEVLNLEKDFLGR